MQKSADAKFVGRDIETRRSDPCETSGSTMINKPSPNEWDASRLPAERRAYLQRGLSFEDIVARIFDGLIIDHARIEPYKTPPRDEPPNTRQIVFIVRVGFENCDLLFNAPDGLRGRYWQSPYHGFLATKRMIDCLSHRLELYAGQYPPKSIGKADPMNPDDVSASLRAPSAKVWPREFDDKRNWLFAMQELIVPRWVANEPRALKQGMWRQGPTGDQLEIKGALLGPPGNTEYVPKEKRARSAEIHCFGFS